MWLGQSTALATPSGRPFLVFPEPRAAADSSLEAAGLRAPCHGSETAGDAPGKDRGESEEKLAPEGGGGLRATSGQEQERHALWGTEPLLGVVSRHPRPASRGQDPRAGRASASCHTRSLTPHPPGGRASRLQCGGGSGAPARPAESRTEGTGLGLCPKAHRGPWNPGPFCCTPSGMHVSKHLFGEGQGDRKVAGGWTGSNLEGAAPWCVCVHICTHGCAQTGTQAGTETPSSHVF